MNEKIYRLQKKEVDRRNAEAAALMHAINDVFYKNNFVKHEYDSDEIFEQSVLFRENITIFAGNCMRLNSDEILVERNLVQKQILMNSVRSGSFTMEDYHIVGFAKIRSGYPRILITPTTLADKFIYLIGNKANPVTRNKKCLFHFNIHHEQNKPVIKPLPDQFFESLIRFKELHLEISGEYCFYVASTKGVTVAEAERFIDLTGVIMKCLI
ncbi:MAG: hypothetical protein WAT43_15270 [Chitinophagales bacterium]